ncbi:MAG: hypothetical protein QOI58_3492 [Thermoanaerobaculia bacterium]|jgi:hypothetical protein|nr:hypothetical protein [Thermoanaerobaculia bacterium]
MAYHIEMPTLKPDVSDDPVTLANLSARRLSSGSQFPSSPRQAAPERWITVDVAGIHRHVDSSGRRVGTRVNFHIAADDDDALWRFFGVRKLQFEQKIRSGVLGLSGGRVVLESIEYRRGSLEIAMLFIAVAGNYSNIKENFPIFLADLDEVFVWIDDVLIPNMKRRLAEFFEEYKEVPLVRLAKSFWKTLFG